MKIFKYKFSSTATKTPPKLSGTPQAFLKKKYSNPYEFGSRNLEEHGVYKEGGWAFDFRPYLKRYFYRTLYGLESGWFPNKTAVRKFAGSRVIEILESKK